MRSLRGFHPVFCGQAQVLLNALSSGLELPAVDAHQQVHAVAGAAALVFAAALVAEPGARTVNIVKAVAVLTTAKGTRLVAVSELLIT
jgi:hypothetical protein